MVRPARALLFSLSCIHLSESIVHPKEENDLECLCLRWKVLNSVCFFGALSTKHFCRFDIAMYIYCIVLRIDQCAETPEKTSLAAVPPLGSHSRIRITETHIPFVRILHTLLETRPPSIPPSRNNYTVHNAMPLEQFVYQP